jgi:capsular polysaccharide biosynthesis protein
MFVVAKICRTKDTLGDSWSNAVISYPLLGTSFERHYLSCLGIAPSSILDSRRIRISATSVVISNTQRSWLPTPSSVATLRHHFVKRTRPEANRRIYVSRSGKRRIVNETNVRRLVESFGVEVIGRYARDHR